MGFKRWEECPDEYLAQRDAAEDAAGSVPDRCALCRAKTTLLDVRRCRECGGPCCDRCRLTVAGRVACYGCLCLDSDDALRLMPDSGREWPAPAAEDYARLDAQVAAFLAEPAEADEVTAEDAEADTVPTGGAEAACRECGEPSEAGWGGYCLPCGAEWSQGPGKLATV